MLFIILFAIGIVLILATSPTVRDLGPARLPRRRERSITVTVRRY
jgi:hypothetical protein